MPSVNVQVYLYKTINNYLVFKYNFQHRQVFGGILFFNAEVAKMPGKNH